MIEAVAQPALIVTLREVEAAVGATTLGTEVRRHRGGIGGLHQVVQLQALDALGIELLGGVVQTGVLETLADEFQLGQPFCHGIPFPEHGEVVLHAALQILADLGRVFPVTVVFPAVEALQRLGDVGVGGFHTVLHRTKGLHQVHAGSTTEHHQIQQGVAT